MKLTIGALCRALVIAIVLAFGLTACMTSSASESTEPSAAGCDQPVSVSQSTPTVAVLGQVGKATEYYAGDFDVVVKGAEAMQGARSYKWCRIRRKRAEPGGQHDLDRRRRQPDGPDEQPRLQKGAA